MGMPMSPPSNTRKVWNLQLHKATAVHQLCNMTPDATLNFVKCYWGGAVAAAGATKINPHSFCSVIKLSLSIHTTNKNTKASVVASMEIGLEV
jgi:hypothetical protein